MSQAAQIDSYTYQGFVQQPDAFSPLQVARLRAAVDRVALSEHPGHVPEAHGKTFRAFHGCHLYDEVFASVIRAEPLVRFAEAILQDEVYVHQLKVNTKCAQFGESWPWHQDFIFWHQHDGIPTDRIINVMIHLDDVDDDNGPVEFIPQSHQGGCLYDQTVVRGDSGWEGNVSNDLTYQLNQSFIDRLVDTHGVVHATGPAGTVWWFSANTCHASSANRSGQKRRVLIITYNAISNAPNRLAPNFGKRPAFLCARDFSPLQSEVFFDNDVRDRA